MRRAAFFRILTILLLTSAHGVVAAPPSCSDFLHNGVTAHRGNSGEHPENTIPAVENAIELSVAGLIAPRHLLAVNGRKDTLFSHEAIERAATTVQELYTAAGCPEQFEHRWGAEGHRFYKDLMWPFVLEALQKSDRKTVR